MRRSARSIDGMDSDKMYGQVNPKGIADRYQLTANTAIIRNVRMTSRQCQGSNSPPAGSVNEKWGKLLLETNGAKNVVRTSSVGATKIENKVTDTAAVDTRAKWAKLLQETNSVPDLSTIRHRSASGRDQKAELLKDQLRKLLEERNKQKREKIVLDDVNICDAEKELNNDSENTVSTHTSITSGSTCLSDLTVADFSTMRPTLRPGLSQFRSRSCGSASFQTQEMSSFYVQRVRTKKGRNKSQERKKLTVAQQIEMMHIDSLDVSVADFKQRYDSDLKPSKEKEAFAHEEDCSTLLHEIDGADSMQRQGFAGCSSIAFPPRPTFKRCQSWGGSKYGTNMMSEGRKSKVKVDDNRGNRGFSAKRNSTFADIRHQSFKDIRNASLSNFQTNASFSNFQTNATLERTKKLDQRKVSRNCKKNLIMTLNVKKNNTALNESSGEKIKETTNIDIDKLLNVRKGGDIMDQRTQANRRPKMVKSNSFYGYYYKNGNSKSTGDLKSDSGSAPVVVGFIKY